MSLKSKKYKLVWVLLLVSIVLVAFSGSVLQAQEQSPNSAATAKLKVLSESMAASDITEIRRLIEAGADVNVINKKGVTPLFQASVEGHYEIVKLLLDAKADVNKARTTNGTTPLFEASFGGHYEIVKLLLDAGADVNIVTTDGMTPLFEASGEGHYEIVKLLLAAGADVNIAATIFGIYGVTPLFPASFEGHYEIVKLLLAAGADVNKARTTNGITPLFWASGEGHYEVVKLLLDAKADVNIKVEIEGKEYTALSAAKEEGHTSNVKLLKEYGAKE